MISQSGKIAVLFRNNKFKGSTIDIINKVIDCFHKDGWSTNEIENLADRLEFITAHKSKGKEYDTVLITQRIFSSTTF